MHNSCMIAHLMQLKLNLSSSTSRVLEAFIRAVAAVAYSIANAIFFYTLSIEACLVAWCTGCNNTYGTDVVNWTCGIDYLGDMSRFHILCGLVLVHGNRIVYNCPVEICRKKLAALYDVIVSRENEPRSAHHARLSM